MSKRRSLVQVTIDASMRAHAAMQEAARKDPSKFVAPTDQVLFVENVADMLGCSVDYVRRIPRRDLPAAKCGPRLQYLRDDVVALVKRRRDTGLGSKIEPGARRSSTALSGDDGTAFDPVAATVAAFPKKRR